MTRNLIIAASLLVSTAATAANATSPVPPSGMLLGIYAFPNSQGLRVLSTMPEYSAHGKLFRNDVLIRVTADGVNIFPTRNMGAFEYAKDQIGPNVPAALEVYRPGSGYIYLWVEFVPVGGQPGVAAAMQARVMTEQQRPGAARLFQRSNQNRDNRDLPRRRGGDGGPANLFGR